ncbi:hypothetical protein GCM10028818_59900 [Spirosoma horti]
MDTKVLGCSNGVNGGWLAQLWLIPIDQVLGVLDPELFSQGRAFTIPAYGLPVAEDVEITRIKFPNGQASFEEIQTRSEEGPAYGMTIEATLPKNELELLDFLHRNQARRWLAIFTDVNGETFVSGEPERGLDLFLSRSIAAINAVKLSLYGRNWHPAFMLEDSDLETLLPYSMITYQADFNNYQ